MKIQPKTKLLPDGMVQYSWEGVPAHIVDGLWMAIKNDLEVDGGRTVAMYSPKDREVCVVGPHPSGGGAYEITLIQGDDGWKVVISGAPFWAHFIVYNWLKKARMYEEELSEKSRVAAIGQSPHIDNFGRLVH